VREAEFPQALWLLDRWHIARAARDFVAGDEGEYRRIMTPVWKADSEAVLEVLRTSPLQQNRGEAFHTLFRYILGNREGIDNWRLVPSKLRRSIGRKIAPVRCGSGVIEKNIELRINRGFKRKGRSWSRRGAEHLAQLLWLQTNPPDWNHWWHKTALTNRAKARTCYARCSWAITVSGEACAFRAGITGNAGLSLPSERLLCVCEAVHCSGLFGFALWLV
jgi:hypothetical protein